MANKIPLIIVIVVIVALVVFAIIFGGKKQGEESWSEEGTLQTTPIPSLEGSIPEEEMVTIGGFEISWSYFSNEGVWIYFDNGMGVRMAVVPVNSFDELDESLNYTYTSDDDYVVFAPLNQILILKYGKEHIGITPVSLSEEEGSAQLNYRYQEL